MKQSKNFHHVTECLLIYPTSLVQQLSDYPTNSTLRLQN